MATVRPLAPGTELDIDDDEADAVFTALSSESARRILGALDDGPATVSTLAERTDLTPQNVAYHLEKLTDADLAQAVGTRTANGNEATVYARDRRITISTDTASRYWHRLGVVGVLIALLAAFTCPPALVESLVPLELFHQFVHGGWPF